MRITNCTINGHLKLLFRLSIALLVVVIGGATAAARDKSSWPIRYRAELLARLIDGDHVLAYTPPSEREMGEITFKLTRTSDFFNEMPNDERLKYAMDLYKVIFSYVLGDSAKFFSKISLSYYQLDDTAVHISFTYGGGLRDSLPISDLLPEDRFILLAHVIPIKCVAITNPSAKYKKRIMGFSLPTRVEETSYLWDEVVMGDYAIVLASLLYDFVLERDDNLVSKLIIQFSDHYADLNASPAAQSEYPMNCSFFQDIKRHNLMMFYHPDASFDQSVLATDIETRLAAISFLAQGQVKYWYYPPDGDKKGRCILDCYCRGKSTDYPFGNDSHLFVQCLENIVIDYCLADSAVKFDSISVRLFDENAVPLSGWTCAAHQQFPNTTEDDRMGLLLNILPFVGHAQFSEREFEVSLREVPDYSPMDKLGTYATILSLTAYEYVFRRQKRTATISFVDKKDQAVWYFPTIRSYNAANRYLYGQMPKRRM